MTLRDRDRPGSALTAAEERTLALIVEGYTNRVHHIRNPDRYRQIGTVAPIGWPPPGV